MENLTSIVEEPLFAEKCSAYLIRFQIEKARSYYQIHSAYKRLIKQYEKMLAPKAKEFLRYINTMAAKGLSTWKRLGKPATMVEKLTDWEAIKGFGTLMFKPFLLEILAASGTGVVDTRILMKQEERFDAIGLEAVKWATAASAKMVVEITDETMEAIRAYIVDGINKGKSVQKIARELRPKIGLTIKDMVATANYEEWLIVNKPGYTAAQIQRSVDTYSRKKLRLRSETISRTETGDALSEGAREGYDQMGIEKLRFVADKDCCDDCNDLNGNIYTIDEAEGIITVHPNCECGWAPVV